MTEFYLHDCYEFRVLQDLGTLLEDKQISCQPSLLNADYGHFESELRRALVPRDQDLKFPTAAFNSVQLSLARMCELLDRMVKPSITRSYGVLDPWSAYPNLFALKRFLENPTPSRIFDMASGPNQILFRLPQHPEELRAKLVLLTVANDSLDCAIETPPRKSDDSPPDKNFRVYEDTTTRDRTAIVLKALFEGFQCKNHEVMVGLPDNFNTGTSQQRIHLWLSLCLKSGRWQEAMCDSYLDGNSFASTGKICNQLQDHSNRDKRLRLTIKRDKLFGTWHSTLSERSSSNPSTGLSLEQLIRCEPNERSMLYTPKQKRMLALRLGYHLLDFYDTEWDSKDIHFLASKESNNQKELLYRSFSSALPTSPKPPTFQYAHPVLVSFAKILLEIYIGRSTYIETSPSDGEKNLESQGKLWHWVDKLENKRHDGTDSDLRQDYWHSQEDYYLFQQDFYYVDYHYLQAIRGCLMVHNEISKALKSNMSERDTVIKIREEIYKEVISNLELTLTPKTSGTVKKRRRLDSPPPDSVVCVETRGLKARGQSTATTVPFAHASIKTGLPVISDLDRLPPQKKQQMSDPSLERILNPSSCNSDPTMSLLFANRKHVYRASARQIETLIGFRQGILPFSISQDLQPARIAIIDTGIDSTHPYISHDYAPERNSPAQVTFRDYSGAASSIPIDEDGHGTFIAGIILQLAPCVELYVARIGQTRHSIATDPTVDVKVKQAIKDAVEWGTDIISMSFGFDRMTSHLREAIALATKKQTILLASVGNSGNHQGVQYPAGEERVFKIFATDSHDYKARISPPSTDPRYTFGILGCAIESTWPMDIDLLGVSTRLKGSWTVMSGASFSTPIVAALVAIIYQFYDENKALIKLGEHSAGLKTINAIRAILDAMSRVSEEHKCNCLVPNMGKGDPGTFSFEADGNNLNWRGQTRIEHFADKLSEIIRHAQV
ncbi:hypothetical protein EMCG_04298 [[Emmonsia] crescens]|uniref:Uncharacterized protein n=1 Tax=[Emmonsia] crescens TaxID=73230 RepID=A0A0G2HSK3_9EURO|nr:hypothetical protein EMCG_04298 [Emmonsia crescens UAMH 3008]